MVKEMGAAGVLQSKAAHLYVREATAASRRGARNDETGEDVCEVSRRREQLVGRERGAAVCLLTSCDEEEAAVCCTHQ